MSAYQVSGIFISNFYIGPSVVLLTTLSPGPRLSQLRRTGPALPRTLPLLLPDQLCLQEWEEA